MSKTDSTFTTVFIYQLLKFAVESIHLASMEYLNIIPLY